MKKEQLVEQFKEWVDAPLASALTPKNKEKRLVECFFYSYQSNILDPNTGQGSIEIVPFNFWKDKSGKIYHTPDRYFQKGENPDWTAWNSIADSLKGTNPEPPREIYRFGELNSYQVIENKFTNIPNTPVFYLPISFLEFTTTKKVALEMIDRITIQEAPKKVDLSTDLVKTNLVGPDGKKLTKV